MKPWQAAVLGMFAVLDCLVVIVGMYLVLSAMSPDGLRPAPTNTAVPPTPTVTQTPSPEPTETPAEPTPTEFLPTHTPTPTMVPYTDWVDFEIPEFTIKLPESYAAGDARVDLDLIIQDLRDKGATHNLDELKAAMILMTIDSTVFWAVDSATGPDDIITNINIRYMLGDPDEPMADVVTRMISDLTGEHDFLEQRILANRNYDIEQVTLSYKNPDLWIYKLAVYVVKDEDIILGIVCETANGEWQERLAQFDLIVKSVEILRAEE